MKLTYLVADTTLFGGVKIALHQANLMVRRGHQVKVVTPGEAPDWFPLEAELVAVERLEPSVVPPSDVCVATYWTTLAIAAEAPCRQAVHYCQGYEGSFLHNRDDHPAIEAAYRRPLPAMAVSPHLVELLDRRFARPARWVPQPLESFWRSRVRRPRLRPHRTPRILVMSPLEIEWKGVATALEAFRRLRRRGVSCRLIRLSQWPLSEEERSRVPPDEFHRRLMPRQVARLMDRCDLLLAPSWEQEGFGLPVLEAMARGLPVVASDVSCFQAYAAPAARLVPPRDPRALAEAAEEVVSSPSLWRRMRRAGFRVAAEFTEGRSAKAAEEALLWSLGGEWKDMEREGASGTGGETEGAIPVESRPTPDPGRRSTEVPPHRESALRR